jgi:EF-P beta-lysylation protein EpmB
LEYLARIRPGDPDDPLLRQVLITPEEELDDAGFVSDPVGDRDALAADGVLHKYEGRALVISTGACGIHCRYCFRKEFPYQAAGSRSQRWEPSIDYVRSHPEIDEVLLSGGDPLTLTDEGLAELVGGLEEIDHVQRLRVHTRMPVVIPQRVTRRLVELFAASRLTSWVVIHANHPRELDEAVLSAVGRWIDRGVPVMNQAVLLRGVNDDADTLIELCRRLVNQRVAPYYLHQLDRVRGAGHFEVPVERGRQLMARLREVLPGYAVPRYVAELPGEASKSPLEPARAASRQTSPPSRRG